MYTFARQISHSFSSVCGFFGFTTIFSVRLTPHAFGEEKNKIYCNENSWKMKNKTVDAHDAIDQDSLEFQLWLSFHDHRLLSAWVKPLLRFPHLFVYLGQQRIKAAPMKTLPAHNCHEYPVDAKQKRFVRHWSRQHNSLLDSIELYRSIKIYLKIFFGRFQPRHRRKVDTFRNWVAGANIGGVSTWKDDNKLARLLFGSA